MQLQIGDWVRTEEGKKGVIIALNRLTAFVKVNDKNAEITVGRLISQLTKIEAPREPEK